jgi:hypothetical protein
MVAMIEAAFRTALVACIGSAPGTRSPCLLAIRTVDLSAKVSATNEENAPAKRAGQLIQGNFVFHPPCGRRKVDAQSWGLYRPQSSSFIRLTEDPERQLWVLILPPPLPSTPASLPSRILLADSLWPRPDGQISADPAGRLQCSETRCRQPPLFDVAFGLILHRRSLRS